MTIQPLHFRDRLYRASAQHPGEPIHLELALGIHVEPVDNGRLLLADGRGAWVSALSLALHLGWCSLLPDPPAPLTP